MERAWTQTRKKNKFYCQYNSIVLVNLFGEEPFTSPNKAAANTLILLMLKFYYQLFEMKLGN